MRRCLVICFALSLLLGGCAKIVVVPVPSGGSVPAEGVIYALPNTVIQVHLKIDKTTKKGAPYAVYAAVFAPDTKPVCEDQACTKGNTEYAVEDGAWSFYILSGGGTADELFFRDFDLEFSQEFGVFVHFLA